MGLLDDAIREHLELRRKHGASDDEIARKETDALGPVRRETLDGPTSSDEETWLGGDETAVLAPPSAEVAPGLPVEPAEVPEPVERPASSESAFAPEPSPFEEPAPGATGWFDEARGGTSESLPIDAHEPGAREPAPYEEPRAPADVFPEPDPTVPDERLSADPPVAEEADAPLEEGPVLHGEPLDQYEESSVVHGEPLDEREPMVSFPDDGPPLVEEDRLVEEPAAPEDEASVGDPFARSSDRLLEEPFAPDEDRSVTDLERPSEEAFLAEDADDELLVEDLSPSLRDLPAGEESLPEEPSALGVLPGDEEQPPLEEPPPLGSLPPEEEGQLEEPPPLGSLPPEEELPPEGSSAPLESLPLDEGPLPADESPLAEDELFEDEAPELAGPEPPLDSEEDPEWTHDELEELDRTAPQGADRAPAAEREDVLEDTPDFLQETPEHDRLWFEQRPPRDFDFDD